LKNSKPTAGKKEQLTMNLFRTALAVYSTSLEKRPMITEMTTSGALWCLGDLATQHIENRIAIASREKESNETAVASGGTGTCSIEKPKHAGIDWKRTLHQTVYASFIWAPFAHKWYHFLEKLAHTLVPSENQLQLLATKFGLEMIWLHPIALFAFFTIVGALSGDSVATILSQLRADYWQTFLLEITLWTPIDLLNFAFVPVRHQLFVVNCGCFLECIALSFIKFNGIEKCKSCLPSFAFLSKNNEKEKVSRSKN